MRKEKPTKVLVVDDNRPAAAALGRLLERDGFAVATAFDGDAALAVALTFYPDVVILDLDMPRKNGFEVARALRRSLYAKTLLVALSGFGRVEHKRMAMN